MEKIIQYLSNPIIWFAFMGLLWFIFKKKRESYLKLLYLLIEAIEVIDKEIKDIIPLPLEQKLIKIKFWINARLDKKQKEQLDTILLAKGLLNKSKLDN